MYCLRKRVFNLMYFKSIFYPLVGGTGYFFGFLVNGFTFPAFSQEGVTEFFAFFKFVFLGDAVPNLFGKSFKTLEVFFRWDTLQGFGDEVIGYFSGFEFVFDSDFTPFFLVEFTNSKHHCKPFFV